MLATTPRAIRVAAVRPPATLVMLAAITATLAAAAKKATKTAVKAAVKLNARLVIAGGATRALAATASRARGGGGGHAQESHACE